MSQFSSQFPPSSPLRDSGDGGKDPFSSITSTVSQKDKASEVFYHHQRSKTVDYPTPNPSSSAGGLSSPQRYDDEPRKVAFNVDTNKPPGSNTLDSLKGATVTQVCIDSLKQGKLLLKIGRGTKGNDVGIKTNDLKVSRSHILLSQTSHSGLSLKCLGHNGFGMTVPKTCQVFATETSNSYRLIEAESPLSLQDLKPLKLNYTPRAVSLAYNHTEFIVHKDEQVEVPECSNILIEINDNILIINPDNKEAEETEDELPITITKSSPIAKPISRPQPSSAISSISNTPRKFQLDFPDTPKPKKIKITSEENTPVKLNQDIKGNPGFSIFNDFNTDITQDHHDTNSNPVKPYKKQLTPLNNKTNIKAKSSPLTKRKTKSEEPQSRKHNEEEEEEVAEKDESIENIENLEEVNNILVNHLAFSRLSSTPISTLKTISAITDKLTVGQLRHILKKIQPVGIISREGKDAAGKPLEEQYYYMPENDTDRERPKLVGSIKGHGGLRSCRRTHKQYYWKKPAPIKKENNKK